MPKPCHPSRPACEILAYFLRNPAASDSLEGIARWRLLEEAIHRKVMETKDAVEWLVKEGFLIETAHPSTGKLFRLNPERRNQAELLVEESGEGSPDKVSKS